jgi:hypothetical protein
LRYDDVIRQRRTVVLKPQVSSLKPLLLKPQVSSLKPLCDALGCHPHGEAVLIHTVNESATSFSRSAPWPTIASHSGSLLATSGGAGKGPANPLVGEHYLVHMQRISSARVGPVLDALRSLSTASESRFVQLNGLAIAFGQEPPWATALLQKGKPIYVHPFKVPRAESSVRSMAEALAQFQAH